MTQEEKIIATAFTGKMFIDGSKIGQLYEYMEKKVGHGVIDLMLASKDFWEELHKACEQDFIDMISKEQPSLPSNLDEAAEKYSENILANNEDLQDAIEDAFKAGAEWMAEQGIKLHGRILPGPRCNLYIESDCFDRGYKGLNYRFSDSNDVDMFVQIRKK